MIKKIEVKNIDEAKKIVLDEMKCTISFKNLTHDQVLSKITHIIKYDEKKLFAVDDNKNFYSGRIEGDLIEIGNEVLNLSELDFEEENEKEEVVKASSESDSISEIEEKNNNDLKEDKNMKENVYNIVAQYNSQNGKIKKGDTIYGTTSELEFDSISGNFEKCNKCIECKVREISRDFSNFHGSRCRTGGCYGYYEWEVIEVLN